MPREYFPSKFHLDNRVRYFLWSSDVSGDPGDCDEVWTINGIAPTFATLEGVRRFALNEVGVPTVDEGEPGLHELDWVKRWLRLNKNHLERQMEANKSLVAWNIFSDLARSLKVPFCADWEVYRPTYMKLLFGDNSGSIEYVDPRRLFRWSGAELQLIHDVLDAGLKLWRAHVR